MAFHWRPEHSMFFAGPVDGSAPVAQLGQSEFAIQPFFQPLEKVGVAVILKAFDTKVIEGVVLCRNVSFDVFFDFVGDALRLQCFLDADDLVDFASLGLEGVHLQRDVFVFQAGDLLVQFFDVVLGLDEFDDGGIQFGFGVHDLLVEFAVEVLQVHFVDFLLLPDFIEFLEFLFGPLPFVDVPDLDEGWLTLHSTTRLENLFWMATRSRRRDNLDS